MRIKSYIRGFKTNAVFRDIVCVDLVEKVPQFHHSGSSSALVVLASILMFESDSYIIGNIELGKVSKLFAISHPTYMAATG